MGYPSLILLLASLQMHTQTHAVTSLLRKFGCTAAQFLQSILPHLCMPEINCTAEAETKLEHRFTFARSQMRRCVISVIAPTAPYAKYKLGGFHLPRWNSFALAPLSLAILTWV